MARAAGPVPARIGRLNGPPRLNVGKALHPFIYLFSGNYDMLAFLLKREQALGDSPDAELSWRGAVPKKPSSAADYYLLGLLQKSEGQGSASLSSFSKAFALGANSGEAGTYRSALSGALERQYALITGGEKAGLGLEDYEQALMAAQALGWGGKKTAALMHEYGSYLWRQGDTASALNYFNAAIEADNSPAYRESRGMLYLELGGGENSALAMQDLEWAYEHGRKSLYSLVRLADACRGAGELEAAYQNYKSAQSFAKLNGRWDDAREIGSMMEGLAGDFYKHANSLLGEQKYEEAMKAYGRCLDMDSLVPEACIGIAACNSAAGDWLMGKEDYSQAEAKFRSSVKYYEKALKAGGGGERLEPRLALAYFSLAQARVAQSELEDAEKCLRRAMELEPGNPAYSASLGSMGAEYAKRGNQRLLDGDWGRAQEDFTRAAELGAGDAGVMFGLGISHYEQSGGLFANKKEHLKEAIGAFGRALALEGDNSDVLHARALAWMRLGDYARAESDLERTVSLAPAFVAARSLLADAKIGLGDYEGAARELARCMQLEPDSASYGLRFKNCISRLAREAGGHMGGKRCFLAQELYARIAALDPSNSGAREGLAAASEAAERTRFGSGFRLEINGMDDAREMEMRISFLSRKEAYFGPSLLMCAQAANEVGAFMLSQARRAKEGEKTAGQSGEAAPPASSEYYVRRAKESFELALSLFERARDKSAEAQNPGQLSYSYFSLGNIALAQGDSAKALEFYDKSIAASPSVQGLLARGGLLLSLGGEQNVRRAIEDLEAGRAPETDDPSHALALAEAYHARLDFKKAREMYGQVFAKLENLGLKPEDLPGLQDGWRRLVSRMDDMAQEYFAKGVARLKEGDTGSAEQYFDQAIDYNASNSSAYAMRAALHMRNGNSKFAIEDAQHAITLLLAQERPDPKELFEAYYMAGTLLRSQGDYGQARPLLEKAIETSERANPQPAELAECQYGLAKILSGEGRGRRAYGLYSDALANYGEGYRDGERLSDIRYEQAAISLEEDEAGRAQSEIDECLRLGGKGPKVLLLDARILYANGRLMDSLEGAYAALAEDSTLAPAHGLLGRIYADALTAQQYGEEQASVYYLARSTLSVPLQQIAREEFEKASELEPDNAEYANALGRLAEIGPVSGMLPDAMVQTKWFSDYGLLSGMSEFEMLCSLNLHWKELGERLSLLKDSGGAFGQYGFGRFPHSFLGDSSLTEEQFDLENALIYVNQDRFGVPAELVQSILLKESRFHAAFSFPNGRGAFQMTGSGFSSAAAGAGRAQAILEKNGYAPLSMPGFGLFYYDPQTGQTDNSRRMTKNGAITEDGIESAKHYPTALVLMTMHLFVESDDVPALLAHPNPSIVRRLALRYNGSGTKEAYAQNVATNYIKFQRHAGGSPLAGQKVMGPWHAAALANEPYVPPRKMPKGINFVQDGTSSYFYSRSFSAVIARSENVGYFSEEKAHVGHTAKDILQTLRSEKFGEGKDVAAVINGGFYDYLSGSSETDSLKVPTGLRVVGGRRLWQPALCLANGDDDKRQSLYGAQKYVSVKNKAVEESKKYLAFWLDADGAHLEPAALYLDKYGYRSETDAGVQFGCEIWPPLFRNGVFIRDYVSSRSFTLVARVRDRMSGEEKFLFLVARNGGRAGAYLSELERLAGVQVVNAMMLDGGGSSKFKTAAIKGADFEGQRPVPDFFYIMK